MRIIFKCIHVCTCPFFFFMKMVFFFASKLFGVEKLYIEGSKEEKGLCFSTHISNFVIDSEVILFLILL